MPSPSRKSSRVRSRSPARSTGKDSKSRSRSRGRSKSPARKTKASPPASPSRTKATSSSHKRKSPARERSTPTRQSTRIAEKVDKDEPEKIEPEKTTTTTTTTTRTITKTELKRGAADIVDGKEQKSVGTAGVLAALAAMVAIVVFPLLVLYVTLACTKEVCDLRLSIKIPRTLAAYYDRDALLAYSGLAVLLFVLNMMPVGKVVEGLPVRMAKRQKYKFSAFWNTLIVLVLYGALAYRKHPLTTIWYDKLPQMAVAGCALSFPLALFVHLRSRNAPKNALSGHGNTGNPVVDFLFGRELNPTLFGVSLKLWLMHFGLTLWLLTNLATVAKSCMANKTPSHDLLLVTAVQTWFILDLSWFEESVLGSADVQNYGCGYMPIHACLAFIPFLYNLQARYLLYNPQTWSHLALAGFAVMFLMGYILFRGANNQKYYFRKNPHDPSLAHLESLPTATNKRLLCSGWWGLCRKPNYLGDLIMSFSWTLPCGFASGIPYVYPVFLTLLLVMRIFEDDALCKKKYGSAWDRYRQRVKSRLVPYIF